MIKECNFKYESRRTSNPICGLGRVSCLGEDNCILYQIYKETYVVREVRLPIEPPIKTVDNELKKKKPGDWSMTIKSKRGKKK